MVFPSYLGSTFSVLYLFLSPQAIFQRSARRLTGRLHNISALLFFWRILQWSECIGIGTLQCYERKVGFGSVQFAAGAWNCAVSCIYFLNPAFLGLCPWWQEGETRRRGFHWRSCQKEAAATSESWHGASDWITFHMQLCIQFQTGGSMYFRYTLGPQ